MSDSDIAWALFVAQNLGMSCGAHSTIWKGQDMQFPSNAIIERVRKIWSVISGK